MIKRALDLKSIEVSCFLLGPRQVGKTCLIGATLQPDFWIDLLNQGEFIRYSKNPDTLFDEVQSHMTSKGTLVVIDEIQRCPELLNVVHRLLSKYNNIQFVLTGSSARKLRCRGVNLLGGRAATFHLHPFTANELQDEFKLDVALRFGTLPKIYLAASEKNKQALLKGYVETYLKEEVQQEALTRNIPSFARFLELAAFENGNILNFSNLSREVGVDAKTLKGYFQVLEDTLLGFWLFPYARSHRERLVKHPKFYFFDTGVCRALRGELANELVLGSSPYGYAFEHWILCEARRTLDYGNRSVNLYFYATNNGTEVDLILEWPHHKTWAIEIKSSSQPNLTDLKGLKSFISDHKVDRVICACNTPRRYVTQGIEFLPWHEFISGLDQ